MKRFTRLYFELDATTRLSEKVAAMTRYFSEAPPEDAAWGLEFLGERKLARLVNTRQLRQWCAAETDLPEWLVDESYHTVGDLSEALALLLPDRSKAGSDEPLHLVVTERLLPLRRSSDEARRDLLVRAWREFDRQQRLVFHKLIVGNFRVGVARKLVAQALSQASGVPVAEMSRRMMGPFEPTAESFRWLTAAAVESLDGAACTHGAAANANPLRPYPFYLAYPLDGDVADLGEPAAWQAEWKWDGIRAQLIRRADQVVLWTRGEELVTERYPEVAAIGERLRDGTVLDGEILAFENERPLPFAMLQRRIGRKREDARLFAEVPVVFMAYDLLELDGKDWRPRALSQRRAMLETLAASAAGGGADVSSAVFDGGTGVPPVADSPTWTAAITFPSAGAFKVSPLIPFQSWDELKSRHAEAAERLAEGLMLKRLDSPYGVGRQRGHWWKWKVDPFHFDGVLIQAQLGHGRRANLYTDYTFGVWDGQGRLVPVAKAYSGLTDEEILEVDAFVRRNTLAKHGPVRTVKPERVFEIAFERIQESGRHKSGLAVRFPRMARPRLDKTPAEADTLDTLRAILREQEARGRG